MAGPIGIVQLIHQSWEAGVKEALFWMGVISLNLGVINLLPIPVLDGGHIFFSLYEAVTKRRISGKTMERLVIPFVGPLVAFFLFITFHDLARLFPGSFKMNLKPQRAQRTQRKKNEKMFFFSVLSVVDYFFSFSCFLLGWPNRLLQKMTFEEKVGQLFIAPASSRAGEDHFADWERLLNECHIGGAICMVSTLPKQKAFLERLQKISKIPLLVAADLRMGAWYAHDRRDVISA